MNKTEKLFKTYTHFITSLFAILLITEINTVTWLVFSQKISQHFSVFFRGETKHVFKADEVLQLGSDYFHQSVDDWKVTENHYFVFSTVNKNQCYKNLCF